MKENKYDDEIFFQKYAQMNRSKDGLIAAGEWETLQKMLPSFNGRRLLDIGCGYGWHIIYALQNGAKSAVGVDISQKMLEVARDKTPRDNVQYICTAMEDMEFAPMSFDIALSSLALHYIRDFDQIASKVSTYLKSGGAFVFSVEHPMFTAYGSQDWYRDSEGKILHFPVDNYFYEGERKATFLGEQVTKYHKTLTTYTKGLTDNGFEIVEIVEPKPSPHLIQTVEGMRDEMRRPMMLLISAVKK